MANYGTANDDAISATSGAGVADVITLKACDRVRVINRSGAAAIYFRTDGAAPVAGAADNFVVPAAAGAQEEAEVAPGGAVQVATASSDQYHPVGTTESAVTVRLIAAAATDYTVEVVQ